MKSRGLVLLLATSSACTLRTAPSPDVRALVANGPVVAGAAPPEIELEGFARGRLDAVGHGAKATFVACGQLLAGVGSPPQGEGLGMPSAPEIFAAALILTLGICTASSAVGGAVSAATAPGAESVLEAEGQILSALEKNPLQAPLREAVLANAHSFGIELASTVPEPDGALLEVALTRVSTSGVGVDPPLWLFMTARARIVRARDGTELYAADYRYDGGKRTLREWAADGAAPLLEALASGYESLGARIFEDVFAVVPLTDRELHTSELFEAGPSDWLPISPKTRRGSAWSIEWETVESLQPILRWQSFPRASDFAAQPDLTARVSNVRYDLRVAIAYEFGPTVVIYERDGLPTAEHRIEEPLQEGTVHFWTVRARFDFDGRTQVTEWSALIPACHSGEPAGIRKDAYGFRTP